VIRVIKIGGSLLKWTGLRAAFDSWIARQAVAHNVLVAGGGPLVNGLRQVDAAQRLDAAATHWLAVRAMSLTARVVADVLDLGEAIVSLPALEAWFGRPPAAPVVLDVEEFLRKHEPSFPGPVLPQDWSVTSDSIAARVAAALGANELCLLKSALPPAGSLSDWAAEGMVDEFFPQAAAELSVVRLVNLRDAATAVARPLDTATPSCHSR